MTNNHNDEMKNKMEIQEIIPGIGIEYDPDEAERMGAFEDDAMSEEDFIEASIDPEDIK